MIIKNGYIKCKVQATGELDNNGFPVQSPDNTTDYIPCQVTITNYNRLAEANGEHYIQQAYNIYINGKPQTEPTCIILFDVQKNILCELQVKQCAYLQAVNQTLITT